jgi:TPR repeat protein
MKLFLSWCLIFVSVIYSELNVAKTLEEHFEAGFSAYDSNDYATAKKEFEICAKEDHSGAQTMLGAMYYDGEGVRKDYHEAVKWFRLAVSKKEIPAVQVMLAQMYYRGEGVPKDYHEAFKWSKAAATQHHPYAQRLLGLMYFNGEEVDQNYHEAFKWCQLAANQKDGPAQTLLGIMYYEGKGVRQNRLKAKEWFGKACDNGCQIGCDEYRKMNEIGY